MSGFKRNKPKTNDGRLKGRAQQRRKVQFLSEDPYCRRCREQGKRSLALWLDHIVPLSKGGTEAWENLQGLCDPCHRQKQQRKEVGS